MIELARSVLEAEAEAIMRLREFMGPDFEKACHMIDSCEGRLVVSGMGKSGLIGRKISATFASLGVSSMFLHPAEAIHGDLGMIKKSDTILALSNSGETKEVIRLVPFIRRLGGFIISLVGNMDSYLARNSDIAIYTGVEKEACPLNLAPTSSTTAALAVGDALAVAVAKLRDVKEQDFAMYHPGGSLGQKLLYRVEEVMHSGDRVPAITPDTGFRDAVSMITEKGFGFTLVIDSDRHILGILTDGDIRRSIQKGGFDMDEPVTNFMTGSPKTVTPGTMVADALSLMEKHSITSLAVIDENERLQGIVHLHDLLGRGKIRIEV